MPASEVHTCQSHYQSFDNEFFLADGTDFGACYFGKIVHISFNGNRIFDAAAEDHAQHQQPIGLTDVYCSKYRIIRFDQLDNFG